MLITENAIYRELLAEAEEREAVDSDSPKDGHMGVVCEVALVAAIKGMSPPRIKLSPDKIIEFFEMRAPISNQIIPNNLRAAKKKGFDGYLTKTYELYVNTYEASRRALSMSIQVCEKGKMSPKNLRDLVGSNHIPDASSTAEYDVVTTTANIHVKLNQSSAGSRTIGSEGLSAEEASTIKALDGSENFGKTFEFWQRSFVGDPTKNGGARIVNHIFKELKNVTKSKNWTDSEFRSLAKAMFDRFVSSQTGRLKGSKEARHAGRDDKDFDFTKGMKAEDSGYEFTLATVDLWFDFLKNIYKTVWKDEFKKAVHGGVLSNAQNAVLRDLQSRMSGEKLVEPKTTLWFMYERNGQSDLSPTVTVKRYQFSPCGNGEDKKYIVVGYKNIGNQGGEDSEATPRTILYVSESESGSETDLNNPAKELFYIELRTDGDNKPPQIKLGRGLALFGKKPEYNQLGHISFTAT